MNLHPYNTICHDTTPHNMPTKLVNATFLPRILLSFWELGKTNSFLMSLFPTIITKEKLFENEIFKLI